MKALRALALTACLISPAAAQPQFTDMTLVSGLRFVHDAAKTDLKRLPETMGAGVVLIDHDGDGDLDLYFVQGRAVVDPAPGSGANELWRNDGEWSFTRVEGTAGAGDTGLGMGACAGDVDGDGDADLFVTNLGPDALYFNRDGRFERAGAGSGIAGEGWSASCTFGDFDCDGDLDLYTTAYVEYDPATEPWCGDPMTGVRSYCHPRYYEGARDTLYLNDGRGVFRDATGEAGMAEAAGKGLGVVASDVDSDGDLDIMVANDSTPNLHWRNAGDATFEEIGALSGFAFSENGRVYAGMGIAAGDADGDGRVDIFVTNLDLQTNTLYLGLDRRDRFDARGGYSMMRDSLAPVGWGTLLWDPDLDGDLDVFVTNGHVLDNVERFSPGQTHAQADQLFENLGGGEYRLLGPSAGLGLRLEVGRGAAAGDLDGDGDPDLVVTRNGGRARLFRNEAPAAQPRLVLELRGGPSNREALGALVEVFAVGAQGERPLLRAERQGASSYLSQGGGRLHLACPSAGADVRVHWPSGSSEWWSGLSPGELHRLVEGGGAATRPAVPVVP